MNGNYPPMYILEELEKLKQQNEVLRQKIYELEEKTSYINFVTYKSGLAPGHEAVKAAISSVPAVSGSKVNIIFCKNLSSMDELLIGQDIGLPYLAYLKISYYEGVKIYVKNPYGWTIAKLKQEVETRIIF